MYKKIPSALFFLFYQKNLQGEISQVSWKQIATIKINRGFLQLVDISHVRLSVGREIVQSFNVGCRESRLLKFFGVISILKVSWISDAGPPPRKLFEHRDGFLIATGGKKFFQLGGFQRAENMEKIWESPLFRSECEQAEEEEDASWI